MAKLSREQLSALLKAVGEDPSFQTNLRATAEQAILTLGIKLRPEDVDEFQQHVFDRFQLVGALGVPNDRRFTPNLFGHGDFHRVTGLPKSECSSVTLPGYVGSSVQLPPWGRLDEYQALLAEHWQIPKDWALDEGSSANCPQWRAWIGSVVLDISRALWPVYEPSGVTWATDAVAKLTEADFQLLAELHPYLRHHITDASDANATHATFFSEEDQGPFGAGYVRYDNTLGQAEIKRLPAILEDGFVWKVGTLHLQLKQIFQRPRAYQVAQILGKTTYKYLAAVSANSPSLVSGHCLQGSLAGCHAFEKLGSSMSDHSRQLLKQFTVDIGDRRVFAGVHYPSDNLSSWYTALNLVPHVFATSVVPSVMQFLWQAITQKSDVYRAIRSHVEQHSDSPYIPAMKALDNLAP
jgi:hypothetical protein